MGYHEPLVTLLTISRIGDSIRGVLALRQPLTPPLAPASLCRIDVSHNEVLPVHKIINQENGQLCFETYQTTAELPDERTVFIFRSWWQPDQFEAAADTRRVWVREFYPDNGDHEHCFLTWERISAHSLHSEGYRCGRDWITIEAYETYIAGDLLQIRT